MKAFVVQKAKGYDGNNREPSPKKSFNVKEALCWDCREVGHLRTKCPHHFCYHPDKDSRKGKAPPSQNKAEEAQAEQTSRM